MNSEYKRREELQKYYREKDLEAERAYDKATRELSDEVEQHSPSVPRMHSILDFAAAKS